MADRDAPPDPAAALRDALADRAAPLRDAVAARTAPVRDAVAARTAPFREELAARTAPVRDGLAARMARLRETDPRTAGAAVVAGLAAVPLVSSAYHAELALTALVFAMLGVSWNLLAGYAGQISLGHAAFFGVGAYVSAWLTTPGPAGLPSFWLTEWAVVAVAAGALAAALLALATGPAMFRLHGHYFAIGTLALAAIVQLLFVNARVLSGGATGYYVGEPTGPVAGAVRAVTAPLGVDVSPVYYVGLGATVLVVAGTYRVVDSRPGLGMRAVKGDEVAAASLGVNPLRYKLWAFVVSSAFAGLAGGVFGQYTRYLNPDTTLGVPRTIDTLVVVILGGMGTMPGPLFGAGVFVVLDNAFGDAVGGLSTTVEGLFIIVFAIFLPHGLWGYLAGE